MWPAYSRLQMLMRARQRRSDRGDLLRLAIRLLSDARGQRPLPSIGTTEGNAASCSAVVSSR